MLLMTAVGSRPSPALCLCICWQNSSTAVAAYAVIKTSAHEDLSSSQVIHHFHFADNFASDFFFTAAHSAMFHSIVLWNVGSGSPSSSQNSHPSVSNLGVLAPLPLIQRLDSMQGTLTQRPRVIQTLSLDLHM